MAPRRRLGKKLLKSLLPILLILVAACVVALSSIVYGVARPPQRPYLVTPGTFNTISGTALKVTDESWQNGDGTRARGWLLRGSTGSPAVVFLHKYGADRSWLFNLGIKLNETAGYTILWPDLRSHGLNPPVKWTSFGIEETNDVLAAFGFLRTLKGDGQKLVADRFGIYGVELGAYTSVRAALQEPGIQTLVLDSVPRSADELVDAAVVDDVGIRNRALLYLARLATRAYFMGRYENRSTCEMAANLKTQRVLLLAGADDGYLRQSTFEVARCFSSANVEVKTDLPLTGFSLPFSTGEQGENYDRPVIDFFLKTLG